MAVWVRAGDGADADDLGGDIEALAARPTPTWTNGLPTAAWVDLQLDILTGAVVALLGIAVVIALVGHRQHPGPVGARTRPRARAAPRPRPDPPSAAGHAGRRGGAAVRRRHGAGHGDGRRRSRGSPCRRWCSRSSTTPRWCCRSGQLGLVVAVARRPACSPASCPPAGLPAPLPPLGWPSSESPDGCSSPSRLCRRP